eukprot:8578297-Pyramimonas_sp.AAC.1
MAWALCEDRPKDGAGASHWSGAMSDIRGTTKSLPLSRKTRGLYTGRCSIDWPRVVSTAPPY